jgi:hypothetical protein
MERTVFNYKWLDIHEEGEYKIIVCTKITELKNLDKFVCKLDGQWQNQVEKNQGKFWSK